MKLNTTLLLFLSCLIADMCKSQNPHRTRVANIVTDVIELSTCSPQTESLVLDQNIRRGSKFKTTRLAIHNNRLTAFKINYINPLRFNYSITNQYVSQFFDDGDMLTGKIAADTANLKVNDIEAINIFSINAMPNGGARAAIAVLRSGLMRLDSIEILTESSAIFANKIREKIKALQSQKTSDQSDKALGDTEAPTGAEVDNPQKVIENLQKTVDSVEIKITEYQAMYYSQLSEINLMPEEALKIVNSNYDFFWKSILNECKSQGDYDVLNQLKSVISSQVLEAQNKMITIHIERDSRRDSMLRKIERRIEVSDAFVIAAAMEIGKLLQNKVVDYSRVYNQVLNESCLKDVMDSIAVKRNEGEEVFNFIQNISANLSIYINYYQLSNPAFDNLILQINNNYKTLLKFLKVFDHLAKNNTKVFTLPSSNNFKNVDFVRYTVYRSDKITGRVEEYPYEFWIKGGLKIDFSVAVLASGVLNEVYNKMPFYNVPTDGSSRTVAVDSISLVRQKQGKYGFAFGGMVNILWRSGGSWITPGMSVGIAYGSNQNLQFLSAISVQVGKSERLIAHIGIAAGMAERIDLSKYTVFSNTDGAYNVVGKYETTPVANNAQFVYKPFFGLSYNLSKKNSLNAIGDKGDTYKKAFITP